MIASPTDIAWAAGLFEGEGCVRARPNGNRIAIVFSLGTTDLDVLQRFHSIIGCGSVTGPSLRAGAKPIWRWMATSKADALHTTELLRPYLGKRRSEALKSAWQKYVSQPPKIRPGGHQLAKTHCPQGHPYIGANVIAAKNGRRCRTCKNEREALRKRLIRARASTQAASACHPQKERNDRA